MRIFCDTNVIVELLENRKHADCVERILKTRGSENLFFISAGSFLTLAYLVERLFKQKGIHQPELATCCRKTLKGVLRIFEVADLSRIDLESALDNFSFTDLEDSCQYQAAAVCKAEVLLTFNYKDFKGADQSHLSIMTPMEFEEKFPG